MNLCVCLLEPLWRGAVNQFESGLDPAENRIAGKLKKQCQNKNGNTLQVLALIRLLG